MRIIDLTEEHRDLYFQCLEEWSSEIREGWDLKARWYEGMKDRGLCVKLAQDDDGRIGGMIQTAPIEHSPALGAGLTMVLCVWVHGYRRGRGDFQGRGMGSALLRAAEAQARARGALGMAAWGLALPTWMRASWFERRGYRRADRQGIARLLWKPFCDEARPPRWPRPTEAPRGEPGRATVHAFANGWCPAQNMVCERARRACEAIDEPVDFQLIDTSDDEVRRRWGRCDAVLVDGRPLRPGPPPPYETVRRRIARAARRAARRRPRLAR